MDWASFNWAGQAGGPEKVLFLFYLFISIFYFFVLLFQIIRIIESSWTGQLLTVLDKPVAQKSFMQAEEKGKQGLWWGNIVWDRASKKSGQKT